MAQFLPNADYNLRLREAINDRLRALHSQWIRIIEIAIDEIAIEWITAPSAIPAKEWRN
jgi:hypothetical protein